MRGAAALLLVLVVLPFAAHAEDAKPALAPAIEKCIRDNAPGVEAAIPDLNQGVDFLAGNLCAEPIAAEQARQSKIDTDRRAAQMKAACDAHKAHPGKPDGKDYLSMMCSYQVGFLTEPNNDGEDAVVGFTGISGIGGGKPPAVAALAARLLLDLRLAHLKLGK